MTDSSTPTVDATEAVDAPRQFSLGVPSWWIHMRLTQGPTDLPVEELGPEQSEALQGLLENWDPNDGTRMMSVITNGQPEAEQQAIGIMVVHHSAKAGQVMSRLAGVSASPDEHPELASIGKLDDTEIEIFDQANVGPISAVTTKRRPSDPAMEGQGALLRMFLLPQPQSMNAVLILFMTYDIDELRQPFIEMCDEMIQSFKWRS